MNNTSETATDLIIWNSNVAASEEEAAAAAAQYAGYQTRVRRAANLAPAWVEVSGGQNFRFGGQVQIVPALSRFDILIRPEATQGDLWFLESIVDDVRAGLESSVPFRERPLLSRPGEVYKVVSPGRAIDPALSGYWRGTQYLIDCDEPACETFGSFHSAESIDNPFVEHVHERITNGDCEIRVNKMSGESEWRTEILFDGESGRYNSTELASVVTDLQWALAESKKLERG
jgi:hypothetical protein